MSAEDVHTGCDVGHLLHAAWDAGLTVLPILPPVGDVEIRLVSDRDPLGERFVGPLDEAVEAAFSHLCRQGAAEKPGVRAAMDELLAAQLRQWKTLS